MDFWLGAVCRQQFKSFQMNSRVPVLNWREEVNMPLVSPFLPASRWHSSGEEESTR